MPAARVTMQSRRSGAYVSAAVALLSVIPLLCCIVIMLSLYSDLLPDSDFVRMGATLFGLACFISGYCLLRVYPRNLLRLQQYLELLSNEEFPERVALISSEQDTFLLEQLLNRLILKFQDKIGQLDQALAQSRMMLKTIEAQSEEILAAERQRVMLESIGAACHHIGQPTTLLMLYLTQLRSRNPASFEAQNLGPCLEAVEQISDILERLRQTNDYRTVPYGSAPALVEAGKELQGMVGVQILAIGKEKGEEPNLVR